MAAAVVVVSVLVNVMRFDDRIYGGRNIVILLLSTVNYHWSGIFAVIIVLLYFALSLSLIRVILLSLLLLQLLLFVLLV